MSDFIIHCQNKINIYEYIFFIKYRLNINYVADIYYFHTFRVSIDVVYIQKNLDALLGVVSL